MEVEDDEAGAQEEAAARTTSAHGQESGVQPEMRRGKLNLVMNQYCRRFGDLRVKMSG